MKKIIGKREYDTQTAVLVKKYAVGVFGDPAGYEESLYQTPKGLYFIYVNGGSESPYTKENIKSVSKVAAQKWLSEH